MPHQDRHLSLSHRPSSPYHCPMNACMKPMNTCIKYLASPPSLLLSSGSSIRQSPRCILPQTRNKKRAGIGIVFAYFAKLRTILALLLDITLETNTPTDSVRSGSPTVRKERSPAAPTRETGGSAPTPSFPPPSGNPGGGEWASGGKARSLHRSLTPRTTAPYNPQLQLSLFYDLCLKGPTSPRDDGVSAGMASWLV